MRCTRFPDGSKGHTKPFFFKLVARGAQDGKSVLFCFREPSKCWMKQSNVVLFHDLLELLCAVRLAMVVLSHIV